MNVLFTADGCPPIVAEIQIKQDGLMKLEDEDHMLYEIVRSDSIAALCRSDVWMVRG